MLKITTLADDYAGSSRCLSQHGVSFLIEISYKDGEKHVLLFDTGIYAEPIIFNAEKLQAPLHKLDTIVLSHSHYDHTGGLIGLLKEIRAKHPIKIFAHPNIFKQTFYKGNHGKNIGMENSKTSKLVEDSNGVWKLSEEPIEIVENVYFTGKIPRSTSFEKDLTIQLQTQVNGIWVDDHIEEEVAIYIETPKGIVVVSGCSHVGIVNIVQHAQRLANGKKVLAVIGGFHLLSAEETRIKDTAEALYKMGVEKVITGHCTGGKAEYIFQKFFESQFQKLYTGKVIEF